MNLPGWMNILGRSRDKSTSLQPVNKASASLNDRDPMVKLILRQKSLYRKDIDKWRTANTAAINIRRPSRVQLYELYDDVVMDTHLTAVMESRILRVLNTPFKIVDDQGNVDEEATASIKKRWALRFNRLAVESKFWGFSLIRLVKGDTELTDVKLFPREYVVPELGGIRPDVSGNDLITYTDAPTNLFYIPVGQEDDLGLLNKAAPLQIFKKNALAHWGKFQEIYGIPPRIAKTASRDKQAQAEIERWLDQMGSSAYGLFPEGTEFEFLTPNSTDAYMVFDQGIERVNGELSKLILLQTMTTDQGSSRSQAQVHQQKEDEVIESDMVFLEYEWNDKLIPILIQHGYKLEGKHFIFDRTQQLYPLEQWQIVSGLLEKGYNISDEYIKETFFVPVKGKNTESTTDKPSQRKKNEKGAQNRNTYINLRDELEALYKNRHEH